MEVYVTLLTLCCTVTLTRYRAGGSTGHTCAQGSIAHTVLLVIASCITKTSTTRQRPLAYKIISPVYKVNACRTRLLLIYINFTYS